MRDKEYSDLINQLINDQRQLDESVKDLIGLYAISEISLINDKIENHNTSNLSNNQSIL